MHPSTIITPTEAQGILNTGMICASNTVAVSGASSGVTSATAQNATMRVLKTATGTTTVIKTEVTASGLPGQQISLANRPVLDKQRKDLPAQVGSKVIVSPNISAGQLIPLESLLQKQGVTTATSNSSGNVNTFLKIAGTNKSGQQFLQFTTSSSAAISGTSTSAANVSSISGNTSSLGTLGHQYTILPPTRNIISVASTVGSSRQTNLPLTIVSSSESNVADALQPGASIIVANKKGSASEVNATGDSLLSQVSTSPPGKQVQQGSKVKLLATTQNRKSFTSSPIASTTTIQPQNTVFNTKTSLATTDLLNAKIIGVRNIASTKLKTTSSLSLMNGGGLNIAHLGGKPVIIANNSSIAANQGITVSTAHLHNNSVNKSSPTSAMLLTTNANSGNLILGRQNSTEVTGILQYPRQTVQKQQQIISSGGTAVILTPTTSTSNTQLRTLGVEEKTFVKISSTNTDVSTNAAGGTAQPQRVLLSQPIIIPSDVNKASNAINLKQLKVIPISKQPKQ
uniref:Uncharacterized protein n=1 Tax=Anopheles epiroticus TaxID=199890 RepID=A0A182PVA0_9DIPT